MPKIIDHDAYRQELATKAIDVFIEHGYHGLGMRGIADAIGVSKSALYHYFPSKQELFAASTALITQPRGIYGTSEDTQVPVTKDESVKAMLDTLYQRFQGEMLLLLDYIRGKTTSDIASDPLMKLANQQYLNELKNSVGDSSANQAYALMLGGLLMRLFDGNQTEIDEVAAWITSLPSDPNT
ncbi:TetR/AcrR family transcriptional regulator [Photobacterium sanctipauli]|uniref:TetR/AcrR family transcriptional regulator n=1 Tax=Photobacterium sanctipauli TaxID=1342794 RepID=A0A2T3NZQ7_9GAMM|nr:TetR/AcrR family transcriptional regulator [Photobacterium sanctipauli]PSW21747.1 TetR/AcrR family transcriptional regulator [Photobacterium sanctipauli]